MTDVVQKLWGFCHVLRHDGIDYGDYIEQITYLLFLKMADEKSIGLPEGYDWKTIKEKSGTELIDYYVDLLRKLSKESGLLGDIFNSALSRFTNPVNLKRLINLIDETEWTSLDIDVKAAAYEGLLEKAASEGKKGAGQYFTPRILIQSIVRCMKPNPLVHKEFTICDPAAGTGGFLMCSYEWLMDQTKGALKREDAQRIKTKTYFGTELVPRPRRLCLMNLYLHGIEANVVRADSIYDPDPGKRYDVILTNPPFGTKGANQAPDRDDFTISTSSKQLNFLQHVLTILKPGGRAAIVLPDNCLFEDRAGEVFEIVMQECNVHMILRLPRGTFLPYANAQANVVFLQKGRSTENVWIYDCRSNIPSCTKKDRPLMAEMFADFEKCYGVDPNGTSKREDRGAEGRFRSFYIKEIKERGYKLDIKWLKDDTLDDPNDLPEPTDLISEAVCELEAVVDELNEITLMLNSTEISDQERE